MNKLKTIGSEEKGVRVYGRPLNSMPTNNLDLITLAFDSELADLIQSPQVYDSV